MATTDFVDDQPAVPIQARVRDDEKTTAVMCPSIPPFAARARGATRRLGLRTAALVVAFGASIIAATPAQASAMLGGVSVDRACTWQHGTAASLVAWNVYGWRCIYRGAFITVNWGGVNLNMECTSEYGAPAYAGYLDYNNPYSWRCYR